MAAILPSLKIDHDASLSKVFMPHQVMWILDDSSMRLAEKSVRIGWTWGDAFKNTRKRLRERDRDYLFATKDQQSALEYVKECRKFADIYNFTRSILSHGEDSVKVSGKDENGKEFTEEVKFNYIKFDNGSRILAFTSNPYAMAVFGGDVGLDEFAKHKQADLLWETAQGRATWGFDVGVWSAHDGTDTLFYQFAQEAASGKGGWTHYRVTMENAVEMGLVEKINQARGTTITREEFIEKCKQRARLPEIYEQAYNCNPSGSTSAIVPWQSILNCSLTYSPERLHLEAHQVKEIFGEYRKAEAKERERKIRRFVKDHFPKLFAGSRHHRLGFDVAASGEGDLCVFYVDAKEGDTLKLHGLFTLRTDDWHVIGTVADEFLKSLTSVRGAGDETGLGRHVCWQLAQDHPGKFEGVNFASEKHDMGFSLMNQLSEASKIFPQGTGYDDIRSDYFALRKIFAGGKWRFSESRNTLNPASHCDIAWAGALATRADAMQEINWRASLC